MARKNVKYHYYIGIQTSEGMRFVTKINNSNKCCFWNLNEKPLEMSMSVATDTCFGLCLNGYMAVVIKSYVEIMEHFIDKSTVVGDVK